MSGTGTGKFKIDPLTGEQSLVPTYQWEVVDDLFAEKKKVINKNIDDLKPMLKPIARDLYYDRKVEYVNLVEEMNKKEADKITNVLKRTEAKAGLSIED